MRETAGTGLGLVVGLCAGLVGQVAGATDEPVPTEPFALRLSVEIAAHRRLIAGMDKAGYATAPFSTDGCSGGLSTAWDLIADLLPAFAEVHEDRPPWEACCVIHDRAYHAAGGARTYDESFRARFAADTALRDCVLETGAGRTRQLSETYALTEEQITAAYGLIADAMFDAVRLGGGPCSGLPWRWGYGYPNCFWPD